MDFLRPIHYLITTDPMSLVEKVSRCDNKEQFISLPVTYCTWGFWWPQSVVCNMLLSHFKNNIMNKN